MILKGGVIVLCPKCNTVNPDNEKYCRNCGFQLNAARICPQCGKANQHNSKFCDECGATLSPVNSFKKDVISEGEDSSFFNRYKTVLIAALILVLAIGAVAGISLYNGNDNGGDDEPFFPLVSGNNSQTDDNAVLDDNQTDDNKSVDANSAMTNQSDSENKTDKVKSDNKTQNNQAKSDNKSKTEPINMNNKTNNSNKNKDDGSAFEIKMTDVPNLAKEVADRNYEFSKIDYKGHGYSESQCIYIFSKYVLQIDDGVDDPITVKSVSKAPNPDAEDLSQEISRSDYVGMAGRIVSFIDKNNAVPNYVGVSSIGPKDLSPDKMLYLYTQIVLNYGVTGDLPESIEI